MRAIAVVGLALFLAGCGSKSVVQPWKGSEPPMYPHNGPVCVLTTVLPDEVDSIFLGRAVANQQWYGGYAKVNQALADVARSVGADVVSEKRQKMKIGGFAWARPQVWGWARKLKDPASFDCAALGGTVYPGIATYPGFKQPASSSAASGTGYDECMSRVMRISDPALRLQAMTACDGAN